MFKELVDNDIAYMFQIHDKMFNKNKIVVFAKRFEYEDDYDNIIYYKVITIDARGNFETWCKDLKGDNKAWTKII